MNDTGFEYIASVIGEQAATTLMQHYGGIRIHVPTRVDDSHIIAKRIGAEAAAKLVEQFGGDQLTIPVGFMARINARNREIKQRYDAGESAAKIARSYGMTERWVYEIVRRDERDESDQLSLLG